MVRELKLELNSERALIDTLKEQLCAARNALSKANKKEDVRVDKMRMERDQARSALEMAGRDEHDDSADECYDLRDHVETGFGREDEEDEGVPQPEAAYY